MSGTDTQPPTVNCPADQTVTADMGKQTATVQWNPPTATDNSGGNVAILQELTSPAILGVGAHVIKAIAFDSAGRSSSCSFTITVNGQSYRVCRILSLERIACD